MSREHKIRRQASLGTEFRRLYNEDENKLKLMLATVTKVNLKYNTVDVRSVSGDTSLNKSGTASGMYSAKLPIQFGGRTLDGSPYGQTTPVDVGSLVLVGFVDGYKRAPVVLSIYNEADTAQELSRSPVDSIEFSDEEMKRYAQHQFTVYPSLTYDDIDGEGNRTVTFTGKTFFITDSDYDPDIEGVTDDGVGTSYEALDSSYYYSGELIEPKDGKAPSLLFRHVGQVTDDSGNELPDDHVTMVHIAQDGTYRTSVLKENEDWRAYTELTEDGVIRLRRQNDSQILEQGDDFHEIIVDGDGILFHSGDKYLRYNSEGWSGDGAPDRGEKGPQGPQGPSGKDGLDGRGIEYLWDNTLLGIRYEGDNEYSFVDLKGPQGEIGEGGGGEVVFVCKNTGRETISDFPTPVLSTSITVTDSTFLRVSLVVQLNVTTSGTIRGYFMMGGTQIPTTIRQTATEGWYTIGLPFVITQVQEGTKNLDLYLYIEGGSGEVEVEGIELYVTSKGDLEGTCIKRPKPSEEEVDDLTDNYEFIPIATADELDSIRKNEKRIYGAGTKWEGLYTGGLDNKYIQVKDINLSGYSAEGWNPIGTASSSFTGTYDGGNYVITGLEVKGEEKDYQGLFGRTQGATISNVGLIDSKVTGKDYVGGLVGYADYLYVNGASTGTTIDNSYTIGSVTSTSTAFTGDAGTGGLVGYAHDSIIDNSYVTGSVIGYQDVGGLVGNARGNRTKISNSYATGSVMGSGTNVGGLVGLAYYINTINNSYAEGSVEGSVYSNNVGGLVGEARGVRYAITEIINSYSTGSVTGYEYRDQVGGLVGVTNNIDIINSYSTASVEGPYNKLGGLVGRAYDTNIKDSYATGSVTATGTVGGDEIGGLVGQADGFGTRGIIDNSHATGDVTGNGRVGGLVGYTGNMAIKDSYATGEVRGIHMSRYYLGGLVGIATSGTTIENSYATGSVEGLGQTIGGLVGLVNDSSTISNSHAEGSVTGSGNRGVGGLVGHASASSKVTRSHATGDVTGTGTVINENKIEGATGGLVGIAQNRTTISSSHATGAVTFSGTVGGLVGHTISGTKVTNSYATGSVTGDDEVGGLVGYTYDSTIDNSYVTGSVTGDDKVGGLVGHATAGSKVTSSHAEGPVKGKDEVGGLVGYAYWESIIENSYAEGSVEGTKEVGGLVGYAEWKVIIDNSHATGLVKGSGDRIGGLVGRVDVDTEINNSYATGSVEGTDHVGGLVGSTKTMYKTDAKVTNSYATGSVKGTANVGGLVGKADDITIEKSHATGSVTGDEYVGGLVGRADNIRPETEIRDTTTPGKEIVVVTPGIVIIDKSYATGSVKGVDRVGGLVGMAQYRIRIYNSYATGSVTGSITGSRVYVGGLVGLAQHSIYIDNSYATGLVKGSGDRIGGLVGYTYDTIITSTYWDTVVTGQSGTHAGRGEGKTTYEMVRQATYSGWDFETIWKIDEGNDYPKLR